MFTKDAHGWVIHKTEQVSDTAGRARSLGRPKLVKYHGCGLGLDVSVSRRSRDIPTSRLGLVSRKTVNVSVSGGKRLSLISVSAIYVSNPRPIFGQIVQATLIQEGQLSQRDRAAACLNFGKI